MHLSEHFIYRWQRRVGSLPTPELVKALIRCAVVLQRGVIGVDECGDRFVALSMYWIPEIDAVLKINDMTWPHRAITVITPDVLNKKRVPNLGTDTKGVRNGKRINFRKTHIPPYLMGLNRQNERG